MEGIEGSNLDSDQIMEVALRTAVDQTSVNGVTTNTEDTPDRKAVMGLVTHLGEGVDDRCCQRCPCVAGNDRSRPISDENRLPRFHGQPIPRISRRRRRTPSTTIRLFCVGVGFLLEQLWVVLEWAVLARHAVAGRALPVGFAFGAVFLAGIEQLLHEELGWKKKHRTNGEGLPAGYDHGLG